MGEEWEGQSFYEYVARRGWEYDNGWRYKDASFQSFYRYMAFTETEAYFVRMLCKGVTTGETYILYHRKDQLIEIWTGQVESTQDFEQMMLHISEYKETYRRLNDTKSKRRRRGLAIAAQT